MVDPEEVGHGEQRPDPAPAQDLSSFLTLETSVHRDKDATGLPQAQGSDDPLGTVGGPDADTFSGLDARGHEQAAAQFRADSASAP